MRSTRPPFFSFIFILLVGLLASKPLPAQKKFSFPNIHFGMPHFKPLFKKDSTNKIFNPNHWFRYKKEQPYTKNENAMPIAVGYTDFDDNIRDLQLLEKLPTDNSLTIRPYILPKSVTYDSLLKAIDPSIVNNGHLVQKKHFDLQLLPVNFLQKYNSHHPYGWNDGPLSFSKGYQYLVSGGVYMHWRNIHLTLRPEYFHTASESYETSASWGMKFKSQNKFIPGQSSLNLNFGPFNLGFGYNNNWRGPGVFNSLLLSNNAQGFKFARFDLKTSNVFPGQFEISVIGGELTQNNSQGFENKGLFLSEVSNKTRYINILSINYVPIFLKNFNIGANRVFHQFSLKSKSSSFIKDYLPVLLPLFRNVYQDNNSPIDQLLSGYVKFLFPKNHADLYFEYGWNDGSSNLRDLLLDNSHSSASILGFNKFFLMKNNNSIKLQFEATRLAQTPSYLQRDAGNWYVHGQLKEGYTNENQILGAGSGMGNNLQTIALSYNKKFKKYGIKFQHISQNPMRQSGIYKTVYLGEYDWNDFIYGLQIKERYKKLSIIFDIDLVSSKNYLWQDGNNKSNIYIYSNLIYIW